LDRNYDRSPESIFAHLVEIVGGLSLLANKKKKPNIVPEEYVAKALAWWLALCGKLGVRSVEEMVWSKYPAVCPYCRLSPHTNKKCVPEKQANPTPVWELLAKKKKENEPLRPKTLGTWYGMFSEIYEAQRGEDYGKVFSCLTEEVGELAEATRLFHLAPGYFFSEASDFFAWLLHLHGVICYEEGIVDKAAENKLVEMVWAEYPDCCKECGKPLCTCPPVLKKTFGRIAHEMPPSQVAAHGAEPLLTLTEAMTIFELSSQTIVAAKSEFPVTPKLVRAIQDGIEQLKCHVLEVKGQAGANTVTLINTLNKVEDLAKAERVTQQSLEELAHAIAAMPKESQSVIVDFLTDVIAAPFGAILTALIAKHTGIPVVQ
jgi:NTP pyrophosphatase (non-canonical NTP hydrolase)